MTTTSPKIWTEQELQELPDDGHKYELVDGELHIMLSASPDHGVVCANIVSIVREFCRGKKLGVIMDGQAGFYMKKGDLFSPDVSFVSNVRWKSVPADARENFFRGSPDLAVEVLSPTEPRRHIHRKVAAYLENDTAIVWAVDPVARVVVVQTPDGKSEEVAGQAMLSGGSLLPGLSISLSAVFEDADGD